MISELERRHNKFAPYWAAVLVVLAVTGLATLWVDFGDFWKGYVLDITGPAWNYILFRGLFTSYKHNLWRRFFNPIRTLVIFLSVCAAIELAQYFQLYDSTYDKWDLLAYVSVLLPLFLLDSYQQYVKPNGPKYIQQKTKNDETVNDFPDDKK